MVIDKNGNTFLAPTAPVYAGSPGTADAHLPFVLSANNNNLSDGSNIACSICHSSINKNITFIRPSYIEWDVVKSQNNWNIQNISFGPMKEVSVTNYIGGKLHNISKDLNCESCHEDIKQAVVSGGHSNEQWKHKHNYLDYQDMNSYCRSCHKPLTQEKNGNSPYPAYPFNSKVHGAMKISCLDCHEKFADLLVDLNGNYETPKYKNSMGGIEDSMALQPVFSQSYICIACKNAGNPAPLPNNPLHFKVYTEPQVTIYINGTQQYP